MCSQYEKYHRMSTSLFQSLLDHDVNHSTAFMRECGAAFIRDGGVFHKCAARRAAFFRWWRFLKEIRYAVVEELRHC